MPRVGASIAPGIQLFNTAFMAWQRRKEGMAIAFRSRALFSLARQGLRSCEALADLCWPELFF